MGHGPMLNAHRGDASDGPLRCFLGVRLFLIFTFRKD
jgi:hypothetical protein